MGRRELQAAWPALVSKGGQRECMYASIGLREREGMRECRWPQASLRMRAEVQGCVYVRVCVCGRALRRSRTLYDVPLLLRVVVEEGRSVVDQGFR